MFLFLSEFGIPASFAFFAIIGIVFAPVLIVATIFYILRQDFKTSTILLWLAAFPLLVVASFPLVYSEVTNRTLQDVSYYLFYFSYPFGFTTVMLLAMFQGMNDWRILDATAGILVNVLSVFGFVRFAQKFIEKRQNDFQKQR